MQAALAELERLALASGGEWLVGERMTQADITVACVFTFLRQALVGQGGGAAYAALRALAERCEGLPAFRAVKAEFSPPAPPRPAG